MYRDKFKEDSPTERRERKKKKSPALDWSCLRSSTLNSVAPVIKQNVITCLPPLLTTPLVSSLRKVNTLIGTAVGTPTHACPSSYHPNQNRLHEQCGKTQQSHAGHNSLSTSPLFDTINERIYICCLSFPFHFILFFFSKVKAVKMPGDSGGL